MLPLFEELDRIQLYFKKVRTAADEAAYHMISMIMHKSCQAPQAVEKEASRDRIRVDVDVLSLEAA